MTPTPCIDKFTNEGIRFNSYYACQAFRPRTKPVQPIPLDLLRVFLLPPHRGHQSGDGLSLGIHSGSRARMARIASTANRTSQGHAVAEDEIVEAHGLRHEA
jgi:hypothetical protein